MQVVLNGETHTVDDAVTIAELVTQLELTGKYAVELNEAIIPRSEYQKAVLRSGDRIEVVQAIGGG